MCEQLDLRGCGPSGPPAPERPVTERRSEIGDRPGPARARASGERSEQERGVERSEQERGTTGCNSKACLFARPLAVIFSRAPRPPLQLNPANRGIK